MPEPVSLDCPSASAATRRTERWRRPSIAARLRRGERVDIEREIAQTPECADRLRMLFPTIEALAAARQSAQAEIDSEVGSRPKFAEWIAQAAEALEHAHASGVVHRDVKPSNLLVDHDGKLWVTDFGVARFGDDAGLTLTGDLLGTLRYMSPEQALGRLSAIGPRSDVYSLGATLYELLASRPVFEGDDRGELLRQVAFERPLALRTLDPRLPRDLETIALKALEKLPDDRYLTAGEMAADLRRFLRGEPIRAKPPTLGQRAFKWSWRHRGLVAAAGLALVLAVVGLAVGTLLIARSRNEAFVARKLFEDRDRENRRFFSVA